MDTELAAMPIIDIDTHYTEPRDLWTSRAPQKLRDLAPRVEESKEGNEQWLVGDLVLGPPVLRHPQRWVEELRRRLPTALRGHERGGDPPRGAPPLHG